MDWDESLRNLINQQIIPCSKIMYGEHYGESYFRLVFNYDKLELQYKKGVCVCPLQVDTAKSDTTHLFLTGRDGKGACYRIHIPSTVHLSTVNVSTMKYHLRDILHIGTLEAGIDNKHLQHSPTDSWFFCCYLLIYRSSFGEIASSQATKKNAVNDAISGKTPFPSSKNDCYVETWV